MTLLPAPAPGKGAQPPAGSGTEHGPGRNRDRALADRRVATSTGTMSKATFAGHPLHPQLVAGPLALFPFSLLMDAAYRVTGNASYARAAYYGMVAGYVSGAAAGAAGAADYFDIPPGSHTKKIANLHAVMNVGVLALYGVNLLLRRRTDHVGIIPVALNAVGTAGLLASAWFGGHMVYEHGVRVKGVSPVEHRPDAKVPGDERIAHALESLEELAPTEDPPPASR